MCFKAPKTLISSRLYSDSLFVPAHVEMMGVLGIGNNPMAGASVAVAVEEAMKG